MRIVLVSMLNYHFVRWVDQLKDSGHEVFWFDINDNGQKVEKLSWLHQKVGWKLKSNYSHRYFFKKHFPKLYKIIQKYNERDVKKEFEKYLVEVQPDVVHSLALYISCVPIIEVMNKFPNIKWIYSSWGSDLYDYQNVPKELELIKKVLPRVNYMFSDCYRDYEIAKKYGFQNIFLGVFPGGGGYQLNRLRSAIVHSEHKKGIAIKGFQGQWGKAITVLKALLLIEKTLKDIPIVVFGADQEVQDFIDKSVLSNWENICVYGKIQQEEVFGIFAKSHIYIGNSVSDGMPNTMLEAMIMDVFPIQSNPGGVTQELIENGVNGFLIEDVENEVKIAQILLEAIRDNDFVKNAVSYNSLNIVPSLEYTTIKKNVLQSYRKVFPADEIL